MPEFTSILLVNLGIAAATMVGLWLLSIPARDVSFVDSGWAFGLLLMAVATYLQADGAPGRKMLILGLVAAWGVRLGAYLLWRWRRQGPDPRYVAMLGEAKGNRHLTSLVLVFAPQAALLWIVSAPAQLGQVADSPAALGPLAWAGAALAAFGVVFESVGDFQLAAFKANPENRGRVMDRGLWRYTRHPNYFGELCVWWGVFLVAAETGPGLFGILGPIVLTWLLTRVSGAPLLERGLKQSKPEYADYVRRTSGLIPWPPRRP